MSRHLNRVARRLAIVVSTSSPSDFAAAFSLARAAIDVDIDVGVFFMDAAVGELSGHASIVEDLTERGCELIACAGSAHALGVSETHAGMLLGSQDDHAALVHRAERTVAFT